MEKQTVGGKVVNKSTIQKASQIEIVFDGLPTTFWWPYAIPEGTPVKVTVEVGGKARKVKGA